MLFCQAAAFRVVGTNYINNKRTGRVLVALPPARQIDLRKGDVIGAASGGHEWVADNMFNGYHGRDLLPLARTHVSHRYLQLCF